MDSTFIAKFIAVPTSFLLGSYNAVFSQNIIPHLYTAPPSITAPAFAKIYYLGGSTIAPTAAAAILSYAYLSYDSSNHTRRTLYATSGALTFGTLLWTMTAMSPGINRLIEISKDSQLLQKGGIDREVTGLLKDWVAQNYFRSSMHLTAGVIGFYLVLSGQ